MARPQCDTPLVLNLKGTLLQPLRYKARVHNHSSLYNGTYTKFMNSHSQVAWVRQSLLLCTKLHTIKHSLTIIKLSRVLERKVAIGFGIDPPSSVSKVHLQKLYSP